MPEARAMATAALTSIAWAAFAQSPQPPTIRSRTTVVPVDVRVVDGKGNPVTDLLSIEAKLGAKTTSRRDVRFTVR